MFCCAPFVLSLRRVWVDGVQGLIVSMGVGCIKLLQNVEWFVFLFEE
jgi:hypothetical protein